MRAPTGPRRPPHPALPPLHWQEKLFPSGMNGAGRTTSACARCGQAWAWGGRGWRAPNLWAPLPPGPLARRRPERTSASAGLRAAGRSRSLRGTAQPCAAAACRHSSAAGAGARTLAAALQLQPLALGPGQADAGADRGVGARQADHAVQVQAGHRAAPRQQPRGLLRAAPQRGLERMHAARLAPSAASHPSRLSYRMQRLGASTTHSLQSDVAECITGSPEALARAGRPLAEQVRHARSASAAGARTASASSSSSAMGSSVHTWFSREARSRPRSVAARAWSRTLAPPSWALAGVSASTACQHVSISARER